MTTSNHTANTMYEGPLHSLARSAWQSLLVIGVLSVVVGILALVWPGPTLAVAGVLFGVYLLISGILQLVAAFGPHVSAGWRILSLVSGILSFILAFFAFRDIGASIVLLALWIGISWLFRGITVTAGSIEAPHGLPGRGWSIFYGLMLLIGGIALVVWPIHAIATLTLVAGWWLIFMGIMEVVYAFQVRNGAKAVPGRL
ncbi:HdeD family acid-resistance protein [Nocardia sp. alder85J]|uniref:HdeD family acid-resistance protein n=1 Tax=Nocardia sp. alder85J TaxID=2862949 RepID=UPI001CD5C104|nr:HdeD family acid-resistance protein [Nocardia sp. alder85J]MCX4095387.1 HdeD family acid-resistance protein [Nocardia sp. alder85J]